MIPVSLGCVTLVYSRVAPDLLASGVLAALLALAFIHLATIRVRRPVMYSVRVLEATTLAAMIDQAVAQFPAWGVQDTTGARLAFLCLVVSGAGLFTGLLYLLRADRFTRFIPAPVFAGFSNSISLALLISQSGNLYQLMAEFNAIAVASIAIATLAAGLAVRRWLPRWPWAASGLFVGVVLGLAWQAAGQSSPTVIGAVLPLTVPVFLADFPALWHSGVRTWPVCLALAGNAAILGTMIFINTTLAAQVLTRQDRRASVGPADSLPAAASMALFGLLGSPPLSGSFNASAAAMRRGGFGAPVLAFLAVVVLSVYASGMLQWVPLAAVCGSLLFEAWVMFDRPSMRMAADWLRRQEMTPNAREDLAVIGAVTAFAVLVNMVAAVFVGLLLGLALFAARNARRPVRHVWSGGELSSNCARSRAHLKLLAQHAQAVRIFELEGDLFFGAADSLERSLNQRSEGATGIVLDWTRVRYLDTSVAMAVAQFERKARAHGISPIHAGAGQDRSAVRPVLAQHLPLARFAPDLDRALELAENDLIEAHRATGVRDATSLQESGSALFEGLDQEEHSLLESTMVNKLYEPGEMILRAGEPGDELMLLLQGSASVVVPSADGGNVRIAGVRQGATVGDIAFLDHANRSASVIADEPTMAAILHRDAYNALCVSHPRLVQQLLTNLSLTLAARLRHTNRLALAHQRVP